MAAVPGTLFVVATPVGNLEDMTPRAQDTLARVSLIAAEDTRRAAQLLTHFGLQKRLVSVHEHNEAERVEGIIELLREGENVALISDAGTPLISDPGYRLLARIRDEALPVSPIPGCCAAIAALSVSGLPTDRFRFEGFLPAKSGARRKQLEQLAAVPETLVFYESVHRISEVLTDIAAVLGADRPVMVGRELTKLYETIYRGTVADVQQSLAADSGGGKGEFTLVVAGEPLRERSVADQELKRVLTILLREVSAKAAASLAAEITGVRKREAYQLATRLRNETE